MGHLSHGGSRERTQVLRYGFRTINGKTGGVRVEALARAAAAAPTKRFNRMSNAVQGHSRTGNGLSAFVFVACGGQIGGTPGHKKERVVFRSRAVLRDKKRKGGRREPGRFSGRACAEEEDEEEGREATWARIA